MISASHSDDTTYSYNSNDRVPKEALHVVVDYGVRTIEDRAFFECSSLTSIVIPSTVSQINQYAFFGCSSLKSVEIPSSVTKIALSAFYNCSALESMNIPQSVIDIGAHCFSGCSKLRSFVFPQGVDMVAAYTFHECKSLVYVYIPPSVNLIGNGGFHTCRNLLSLTLNPQMHYIGARAFHYCIDLNRMRGDVRYWTPTLTQWLETRFANLPLHRACYEYDVNCEELQSIITKYPDSLELTDDAGFTALHILACNPNAGSDAFKLLVENCPTLWKKTAINKLSAIEMLLKAKGFECDRRKRTISLSNALKQGMQWDDIQILFTLDKSILKEQLQKDEENDLYPFLIAAEAEFCALDISYRLTRESVEYIQPYIK